MPFTKLRDGSGQLFQRADRPLSPAGRSRMIVVTGLLVPPNPMHAGTFLMLVEMARWNVALKAWVAG